MFDSLSYQYQTFRDYSLSSKVPYSKRSSSMISINTKKQYVHLKHNYILSRLFKFNIQACYSCLFDCDQKVRTSIKHVVFDIFYSPFTFLKDIDVSKYTYGNKGSKFFVHNIFILFNLLFVNTEHLSITHFYCLSTYDFCSLYCIFLF